MAGKTRISISIDSSLLKWIDQKVEEGIFASRSHGINWLAKIGEKVMRTEMQQSKYGTFTYFTKKEEK
jgi:metal-responsive CopG/Arc/MetJ family transcriptional regulator